MFGHDEWEDLDLERQVTAKPTATAITDAEVVSSVTAAAVVVHCSSD